MPQQENNPGPNGDAILQALQKSVDNFQEALNLVEKDPELSTCRAAIEEAIAKANEAYKSAWGTILALIMTRGTERPFQVLRPLSFKKGI